MFSLFQPQMKKREALGTHSTSHVINDANKKLTFVPVVFIFVRIWGTIRFIMGAHFHASAQASAWVVPLQVRSITTNPQVVLRPLPNSGG